MNTTRVHTTGILLVAVSVLLSGTGQSKGKAEGAGHLRTLVGRRVTLRGRFSMRGKIGPFVVVSGQPVYLVSSPPSAWGKYYTRMEGERVRVTGELRFYQAPPLPEHASRAVARLPDYFYFEAKGATVRLDHRRRY
jgi:hypothetical protein